MQWKHALIISSALFLFAVAIWPRTEAPAYGNDNKHGESCVHYTINFPETDDEEVARIYATSHIVTVYLQKKGIDGYGDVGVLTKDVKNGLK